MVYSENVIVAPLKEFVIGNIWSVVNICLSKQHEDDGFVVGGSVEEVQKACYNNKFDLKFMYYLNELFYKWQIVLAYFESRHYFFAVGHSTADYLYLFWYNILHFIQYIY